VFLWFVGIGALTVVMSGGVKARVRRPKAVAEAEAPDDEYDDADTETVEFDPAPVDSERESEQEPIFRSDPPSRTVVGEPAAEELDPEDHFVVDETTSRSVVDETSGRSVVDETGRDDMRGGRAGGD
jgi:hypothetical protein